MSATRGHLLEIWAKQKMAQDRPIVVAGAGSIGCFVGGLFASAGRPVSLLARPRVIAEIEGFGLTVTSLEGGSWHVAPQQLQLSSDPKILSHAAVSRSRAPILPTLRTRSRVTRLPMP
jgi:2-dehydropantoate 2-reductase